MIGLGRVARERVAPALIASDQTELVAVAGHDAARAASFARDFHVPSSYAGIDAMLKDAAVDAVYVATPNGLHAEHVIQAARAGKHVLCEKPLALSAAEAARTVATCRGAGVALGVMFQTRYHDGFGELARTVQGGALGEIVVAEIEIGAAYPPPTGWRRDPGLAGLGTLNNQGIHGIDLLRFLLGDEVVDVVAMVDGEPLDLIATALLRFARGTIAYLHSSHSLPHPQNDLVLRGTRGYAVARGLTRAERNGVLTVCRGDAPPVDVPRDSRDAHRKAIEGFVDAVRRGREPSPGGEDGCQAASVIDAIALSIRTRRIEPVREARQPA
jgi:1,5-anhydro-D-fructose reductase (1,5-anhydro-D-mannitol-forming)